MKKKIAALLIALSTLSMLTACGDAETGGSAVGSPTAAPAQPTEAPVSNTAAPAQPTEAPASNTAEPVSDPSAFAASLNETNAEGWGTCGDNLTWYYAKNVLVIRGSGKMVDDVEGKYWHEKYTSDINSVIIEEGCTTIGRCAFLNCTGLTSITIPDSVTTIGGTYGSSAFCGCSGLTSITIPGSVTTIGNETFCGCSGLTSITIPDGVTTIDEYAFADCSGLTSITIPDSVTTIGMSAFLHCSGLTSITIPDGASVYELAFYGCDGLTVTYKGQKYTKANNRWEWWGLNL